MHELTKERHQRLPGGRVMIFPREEAEEGAAWLIAGHMRTGVRERGHAVLGLATGSTPIGVYRQLIDLNSMRPDLFAGLTTYNLDEYYPMSPADPNSYRAFMERHLFGALKIPANRAHVLDGTVPEAYAEQHARDFDHWIVADGGLDCQLLGLGRNGHIGFNEPSDLSVEEVLQLPTRLVHLHPTTRADAIKEFGAEDLVPRRALTVGPATILAARSILVLAFGDGKAEAVAASLTGPITARVPGSLLQSVASRVTWLIDPAAASCLP